MKVGTVLEKMKTIIDIKARAVAIMFHY